MKTYVITLSQRFMKGHPRAWEETLFKDKLLLALGCKDCNEQQDLSGENISECNGCWRATYFPKIHTIRANYPLWEKRMKEVQDGKACLSIRQWSGKPYRSPQIEIARLTAEDGVGIQKLRYQADYFTGEYGFFVSGKEISTHELANNDGLMYNDWAAWFKGYDLSQPLAIIHFTKFRY